MCSRPWALCKVDHTHNKLGHTHQSEADSLPHHHTESLRQPVLCTGVHTQVEQLGRRGRTGPIHTTSLHD